MALIKKFRIKEFKVKKPLAKLEKVSLLYDKRQILDDISCNSVVNLLKELSKENNTILIIVTHDQRLKEKFNQQIELDVN